MFNSLPKLNAGETLIASERDITAGTLQINDAYDLSLVRLQNGNYEMRLFMKLQFFFNDDGMNKWSNTGKQKFINDWQARVRQIWDGHVLKQLRR